MFLLALYPLNDQQHKSKQDVKLAIGVDDRSTCKAIRQHRIYEAESLADIICTENNQTKGNEAKCEKHLPKVLQERKPVTILLQFLVIAECT